MIERVLKADKPYAPPLSGEYRGDGPFMNVRGSVKCGEGAFLLLTADGPAFWDEIAGKGFGPGQKDDWPLNDDLDGWTAEIALAQDTVLSCTFDGKMLRWENESIAIRSRKAREKLYVLSADTAEENLMIVLDTARFLVYGAVGERRLGGYIRNMPQDR